MTHSASSVIFLSTVMLSVAIFIVMLNVVMLIVVAPNGNVANFANVNDT